jgi:3-(3-hydroxy-phenyl)propionate hydroxylase
MPRQNVQPALTVGLLSPQQHAACGTIFPQPWIIIANTPKDANGTDKVRMDTLAGVGWRVVVSANADKRLLQCATHLDIAHTQVISMAASDWREADGVLAHWFAQHQCLAAIVRPDHYVYGVANSAQSMAAQLQELRLVYLQQQHIHS